MTFGKLYEVNDDNIFWFESLPIFVSNTFDKIHTIVTLQSRELRQNSKRIKISGLRQLV